MRLYILCRTDFVKMVVPLSIFKADGTSGSGYRDCLYVEGSIIYLSAHLFSQDRISSILHEMCGE